MPLLIAIFAIFCLAAVVVLCAAFFYLDRLIRACHQFHREAWIAEGSPYFIGAPNKTALRGYIAWMRVSLVWLFRAPAWVPSSPEHTRRLLLFRRCVLIWNVSAVILALGIAIVAGR